MNLQDLNNDTTGSANEIANLKFVQVSRSES